MGYVTLNKGEGTVTMSFAAYKAVFHDSLMLHLLLRQTFSDGEESRHSLLKEFISNQFLGSGFTHCMSPMSDDDTWTYVFGKDASEYGLDFENEDGLLEVNKC